MKRLFIVRTRHHIGQLEFALSLSKALGATSDEFIFQADKDFYVSISCNTEINSYLSNHYPFSFFCLPSICRYCDVAKIRSSQVGVNRLLRFAYRLFYIVLRIYFSIIFSLSIGFNRVDELYLVNDPFVFSSFLISKRTYRFSTQISPTLLTYGVMASALVATDHNNILQTYGNFPSPSLSNYWTDLLLQEFDLRTFKSNIQSQFSNASSKLILLAYRNPSYFNLSAEENLIALHQIRDFVVANPCYRVVYRSHPRNYLKHNNNSPQDLVQDILGDFAFSSSSHLRVLASLSECLISFAGSPPLEAIVVNCPVLEIVTVDPVNSKRTNAIHFSKFNFAEASQAYNLYDNIVNLLDKSSHFKSKQYNSLCCQMPEFSNLELTLYKIKDALSQLPQ